MQAKSHFERAGRVEMGLAIELDDKRNPMRENESGMGRDSLSKWNVVKLIDGT